MLPNKGGGFQLIERASTTIGYNESSLGEGTHHMYSAMIFSVQSERFKLTRSVRSDIFPNRARTNLKCPPFLLLLFEEEEEEEEEEAGLQISMQSESREEAEGCFI